MSQNEAVVVTGFGPFRKYLINPSWEAAQGIKKLGLGEGVEVYIKELPVSYAKAKQLVSSIWETVKPMEHYSGPLLYTSKPGSKIQMKLAVHLGIAPGSKAITLEQSGKNNGYKDKDVCGCCPDGNVCVKGGPCKLDSVIDMKLLVRRLKGTELDVIYSRDAGRYLCDFVYYYSLHLGKGRAVFIHVPVSGSLATPERLVPLLRTVIIMMLRHLEAPSNPDYDQLHAELFNAVST